MTSQAASLPDRVNLEPCRGQNRLLLIFASSPLEIAYQQQTAMLAGREAACTVRD